MRERKRDPTNVSPRDGPKNHIICNFDEIALDAIDPGGGYPNDGFRPCSG